jgi:hypothetical protein
MVGNEIDVEKIKEEFSHFQNGFGKSGENHDPCNMEHEHEHEPNISAMIIIDN